MKYLYYVIFSILIITGLFTVYPVSDSVNLTDQGFYVNDRLSVDTNWEDYGTLDNLETTNDTIYPATNNEGTWTSKIQQGEKFNVVNISAVSDIRDGEINYTIRFWEEDPTGIPNETVTGTINRVEFTDQITNVSAYDYFEVELSLIESAGSANQRPYVDSLNLGYVQNLDRSGLGLENKDFQVLVLFTFIGAGLAAMIKSI